MNKWVKRSLTLLGLIGLVVGLTACGAKGNPNTKGQSGAKKAEYKTASAATEISDFVSSLDFNHYEANQAVFKKADVEAILAKSTAKTKRTGESTYTTTVSTDIKDEKTPYLEFTIKAETAPKAKKGHYLNKKKITEKGDYNKWFTVKKVKKLAAYDDAIKARQDNYAWDDVKIKNHTTIKDTKVPITDGYRRAKDDFSIDDLDEFPLPVPETDGIVVDSLTKLLEADTIDENAYPAPLITGIANGLQQLNQQGADTSRYFFVSRISKTYYMVEGSSSKIATEAIPPTWFLFFRDTNPDDSGLKSLEFVKAVKPLK